MAGFDGISNVRDTDDAAFHLLYNYTGVVSACLLYYDFLLTIKDEMRLVWHNPFSLATLLFLIIRYGFLLIATMNLFLSVRLSITFQLQDLTIQSCEVIWRATIVVNLILFAASSAFVALRITALWSRNWFVGILLFLMGIANPTVIKELYFYGFQATPLPWPLGGCVGSPSGNDKLYLLQTVDFPITFSAISIVYELLCLVLTVVKTFGGYHQGRRAGVSTPLSSMLLRDGSIYFLVLTFIAVLQILLAVEQANKIPIPDWLVGAFSPTPILICRFIMNIRQAGTVNTASLSNALDMLPMQMDEPTVRRPDRFLGSVSGSLDFNNTDDWLNDEDEDGDEIEPPPASGELDSPVQTSGHSVGVDASVG